MTIPEVRDRLRQIAAEAKLPELVRLAEELKRRPAIRRATPRSQHPRKAAIRAYVALHSDEPLQDVATRFGVNIGRVSEALRGKRT